MLYGAALLALSACPAASAAAQDASAAQDDAQVEWSMEGRRFPGATLGLSAPAFDAILALRRDIARNRRARRNLGLGLLVPGSLLGLSFALILDATCEVDCTEAQDLRTRRASRLGFVSLLAGAGLVWLLGRAGSSIRDHRHEIRYIERNGAPRLRVRPAPQS